MYFEHEQFERIDTMKEKPIWRIASESYHNTAGWGEQAWSVVTEAVIAEHERRKAANFYEQIKPLPVTPEWKLPDPPQGEQWHRTDWTQDMLPDGYRPLLLGEVNTAGVDERECGGHRGGEWLPLSSVEASASHHPHLRTTRPLPVKPDPVLAPLGPEDRMALIEKRIKVIESLLSNQPQGHNLECYEK